MVARVHVIFVLCGLFRVQHSEQVGAGDAYLCVEAAFALPHLMEVLDCGLFGALAAADYVLRVQRAFVFLVLQGETVLKLVGYLVHYSWLYYQKELLQAVVEFHHAELVNEGLVVRPFLDVFFVNDDCFQELLERLHTSLYDKIVQYLNHQSFESFEAVETEISLLEIPEAQFSELKLFELASKLLIVLIHPADGVFNVLDIVGLQHFLDPSISLLQDLHFFLQLMPLELFSHGGEAVLIAGNQLDIDTILCFDSLAGRKQQFFTVAEDDLGEVVSFLSVDIWRSYPSAQESLLSNKLSPVLCQFFIIGLYQSLENLIVSLVFLHLHDLVRCKTQAEESGLQIFGESEDAEDEVATVGGCEAKTHCVVNHLYLLGALDNVSEMPSSVILEVALHFRAYNCKNFWKVIVPWTFGPLQFASSLVLFPQQGRIAPVSLDQDLVDALHDFLVFSVFSREVRDELGRIVDWFSCSPINDGGLWNVAPLYSHSLFLCNLGRMKRGGIYDCILHGLLLNGFHCKAFEEIGAALTSQ